MYDINVENSTKIVHWIKNGDILVKFRDRSSRHTLYRNKDKLIYLYLSRYIYID